MTPTLQTKEERPLYEITLQVIREYGPVSFPDVCMLVGTRGHAAADYDIKDVIWTLIDDKAVKLRPDRMIQIAKAQP